jgi:hypothetical protein
MSGFCRRLKRAPQLAVRPKRELRVRSIEEAAPGSQIEPMRMRRSPTPKIGERFRVRC